MTIKESLIYGVKALKKVQIKSALLDAEVLLIDAIKPRSANIDKSFLYSHPEKTVGKKQLTKLKKCIKRRLKGEPVAYLTGHKEFYGLDFLVNRHVLIPRPETELLVDNVLSLLTQNQLANKKGDRKKITTQQQIVIIDVGTGSGCIPITVAKNLYNVLCIKYYGIDNSNKALTIARRNAKMHGVSAKIEFIKSNLLKNISHNTLYLIHNTNLIITANLPYLTPKHYRANPELKFEPKEALVGGHDGLKYYRRLFKQVKSLITNYPLPVTLLIEIDPGQKIKIYSIIKKILPASEIEFKSDLSGRTRLAVVKIN